MDTVNQFRISSYLRHKHNGTTWEQEVKRYNETFGTSLTADGYRTSCRSAYQRFGSEAMEEQPKEMGDLFENFDTENFDLKSVRFSKGKNEDTFTAKSFMLHPKKPKELTPEELMEAAREAFKEADLPRQDVVPLPIGESRKAVIFPAIEAHLGKVADSSTSLGKYDLVTGCCRIADIFVRVAEFQRMHKAGICYLGIGGDLFNRETNGTTSHGTPIPSCTENYKQIFRSALQTYVRGIDTLLEVFPEIHIFANWGNHAASMEFFFFEALRCTFENNLQVTFDHSLRETTCIKFGENALFFNHGDVNNRKRLISSLACEFPQQWGNSHQRYLFEGHLHSQHAANEEFGIISYRVSAPCEADEWHYQNRYINALPGFEFFLMDEHYGLVSQNFIRF